MILLDFKIFYEPRYALMFLNNLIFQYYVFLLCGVVHGDMEKNVVPYLISDLETVRFRGLGS